MIEKLYIGLKEKENFLDDKNTVENHFLNILVIYFISLYQQYYSLQQYIKFYLKTIQNNFEKLKKNKEELDKLLDVFLLESNVIFY